MVRPGRDRHSPTGNVNSARRITNSAKPKTVFQELGQPTLGPYLRIVKLLRFFPVMARLPSLESLPGLSSFARLVKLAFPLFFVFPIVACLWLSFATHGDYGATLFTPSLVIAGMSDPAQYMYALFWSLSLLSVSPSYWPTTIETVFGRIRQFRKEIRPMCWNRCLRWCR
jgi:hypothetical protein